MTGRIDTLTSLRFFAAIAVVVHHLMALELWLPQDALHGFPLSQQVSLFFVLSGYILHLNYRDQIQRIPALTFFILRFARLWPAHIFVIAAAQLLFAPWALIWIVSHYSALEIVQNIALLQAFSLEPRVAYGLNTPAWSISVELFFYALFPLLSPLTRRHGWAAAAGVAALTLLYLCMGQALLNSKLVDSAESLAYLSPVARLLEFAAGIAACETAFRLNGRFPPASFLMASVIEMAVVALVLGAEYLSLPAATLAYQTGGAMFYTYVKGAGAFPAFALLIFVLHRQGGVVSRVLRHPSLVRLGEWSFALYLLHYSIIQWFKLSIAATTPLPGQILMFCCVTLGACAFVFAFVEQPSHAWVKDRWFAHRSKRSPPVPIYPVPAASLHESGSSLASG